MIEDKTFAHDLGSNDDPVFILGIRPRCGTHFLSDLLLRHPDCGAPDPIWEDNLIRYSDVLLNYVTLVSGGWGLSQENQGSIINSFYQHLGIGMIGFLCSKQGKRRFVTKTPLVVNLENFFRIFPKAYLIILIRDGRAVVESEHVSFGGKYEVAMKKWARAAETIIRFDQAHHNSDYKYLIVRYEDLYTNLQQELSRILNFLKLDTDSFDFGLATNLPVRGSSELCKHGGTLHWQPVEKKQDFNPLNRWSHWGWILHARFNRIAGKSMDYFGYDSKPIVTHRFYEPMMHFLLDLKLGILWRLITLKRARVMFSSE